jgi:hypothetical protein
MDDKQEDGNRNSEVSLPIVPARKVFLQPDIKDDEEVAAAHFFDFELGQAGAAVAPGDGDDGEAVAADDGFQGEFDGDVEVRRQDRLDAVDDFFAVGFEGVGRVVESVAEEEAHKGVGQPVHEELDRRIVDGAASLHEAAAEDAVVAFVELFPVSDDIPAVVALVGHEDDRGIAVHGVEAEGDGAAEAVGGGIWQGAQRSMGLGAGSREWRRRRSRCVEAGGFFLEDLPGAVGGAVVDHDDFVRDTAEGQLEMEVLDGGRDAAFLVTRGDDDGEESERGIFNRR